MRNQSILVRVPATVGNFGGAVNSAALALDASLNVKVTPRLDGRVGIRYFGENGERVPRDRSNLVVRAMEAALHHNGLEFTGADFEIYSSVPVAVGLGSSTAAVLAGLVAADRLFGLALDEKTRFVLASLYESRGDNLRAAWFGGFTCCGEDGVTYRRTAVPEDFVLGVVMPRASATATGENAKVAAGEPLPYYEASSHFSRAAALADFFARPEGAHSFGLQATLPAYAKKGAPGLKEVLQVRTPALLSVFICGSGPAVGILAQGDLAAAVAAVRECLARHGVGCASVEFRPTNAGAREWNGVSPDFVSGRGLDASPRQGVPNSSLD